jgi:hypothetical protein
MHKDIELAYQNLIKAVREHSPKTATAVDIFIGVHDSEFNYRFESPEGLKYRGISMRNLAGEWIK